MRASLREWLSRGGGLSVHDARQDLSPDCPTTHLVLAVAASLIPSSLLDAIFGPSTVDARAWVDIARGAQIRGRPGSGCLVWGCLLGPDFGTIELSGSSIPVPPPTVLSSILRFTYAAREFRTPSWSAGLYIPSTGGPPKAAAVRLARSMLVRYFLNSPTSPVNLAMGSGVFQLRRSNGTSLFAVSPPPLGAAASPPITVHEVSTVSVLGDPDEAICLAFDLDCKCGHAACGSDASTRAALDAVRAVVKAMERSGADGATPPGVELIPGPLCNPYVDPCSVAQDIRSMPRVLSAYRSSVPGRLAVHAYAPWVVGTPRVLKSSLARALHEESVRKELDALAEYHTGTRPQDVFDLGPLSGSLRVPGSRKAGSGPDGHVYSWMDGGSTATQRLRGAMFAPSLVFASPAPHESKSWDSPTPVECVVGQTVGAFVENAIVAGASTPAVAKSVRGFISPLVDERIRERFRARLCATGGVTVGEPRPVRMSVGRRKEAVVARVRRTFFKFEVRPDSKKPCVCHRGFHDHENCKVSLCARGGRLVLQGSCRRDSGSRPVTLWSWGGVNK